MILGWTPGYQWSWPMAVRLLLNSKALLHARDTAGRQQTWPAWGRPHGDVMFLGFQAFQGNSRGNHVFYRQISGGSCRFPFVQFWKYESNLPQNAIAYPEMPSRALQKIDLRYRSQYSPQQPARHIRNPWENLDLKARIWVGQAPTFGIHGWTPCTLASNLDDLGVPPIFGNLHICICINTNLLMVSIAFWSFPLEVDTDPDHTQGWIILPSSQQSSFSHGEGQVSFYFFTLLPLPRLLFVSRFK